MDTVIQIYNLMVVIRCIDYRIFQTVRSVKKYVTKRKKVINYNSYWAIRPGDNCNVDKPLPAACCSRTHLWTCSSSSDHRGFPSLIFFIDVTVISAFRQSLTSFSLTPNSLLHDYCFQLHTLSSAV